MRRTLYLSILLCAMTVGAWAQASPPSTPRASLDALRAQHQVVLDALNGKDSAGTPVKLDAPKVPALIKQGWRLAGEWAAAYLETHPAPSTLDLKNIFKGFAPPPHGVKSQYGNFLEYKDYSLQGAAHRIAKDVYVVEASYGIDFPTTTFMVVARDHTGHFAALWNIEDLAEQHYAQRDEIGRWAYLTVAGYYDGNLDVQRIRALPTATNGNTRFLVDAYQASAAGGTILGQLSLWEWDGKEAHSLLIKTYEIAADYGGFHFDGQNIRIKTKEETTTFLSCGGCADPKGLWSLRVTPTGVQDLGHRYLKPEYQWADALITAIAAKQDASQMAAPEVIRTLQEIVEQSREEARKLEEEEAKQNPSSKPEPAATDNYFTLGMLDECRVLRRGHTGVFVLKTDDTELRFTYVLSHGKPYFTKLADLSGNNCEK